MVDLVTAVDGEVDAVDVADSVIVGAEVVAGVHPVEAVEVLARVVLPASRARRPHFSCLTFILAGDIFKNTRHMLIFALNEHPIDYGYAYDSHPTNYCKGLNS